MSLEGLERAEEQSSVLYKRVRRSISTYHREVLSEIEKIRYLLDDPKQLAQWANSPAGRDRVLQVLTRLDEVEALYKTCGDTEAGIIFKKRMTEQLKSSLTNLEASKIDSEVLGRKLRVKSQHDILDGLTDIRQESALHELYIEAKLSGGFISSFERPVLSDIVTMETKAGGSKTIGEYMTNLFNANQREVKDIWIKGIVRGQSYETMTKRLVQSTALTTRKAGLLIRTEANAIFNDSVKQIIDTNPLVKGYRFRAVLDSRTSDICQKHDGEYIAKEDIKPGINFPPLHPNCRSTVSVVMVTESDKEDDFQRYVKSNLGEWEEVPKGMTYSEYKSKYGFSNGKPKDYTPVIQSGTDVSILPPNALYRGYVKPPSSAVKKVNKLLDTYIGVQEGDVSAKEYLDIIRDNTQISDPVKALTYQAQVDTGFNSLPTLKTPQQFEKEVSSKSYRRIYRQFAKPEYIEEYIRGDKYIGTGSANFGGGTYFYTTRPEGDKFGNHLVEAAIVSPESKILKIPSDIDSQLVIGYAETPDKRINKILSRVAPDKRKDVISLVAMEYGYDGIEVTSQLNGNYVVMLNRSAVMVKQPKIDIVSSTPVVEEYKRYTAKTIQDAPKVRIQGIEAVKNAPASVALLDKGFSEHVSKDILDAYTRVARVEPEVTHDMIELVSQTKSKLEGIEFDLKSPSSLERKVSKLVDRGSKVGIELSPREQLEGITDILRYTEVTEHDSIVSTVKETISKLQSKGYSIIELDNKFLQENASYVGVHILAKTKGGIVFEIQIHSPETLKMKNYNHSMYEQVRRKTVSESKRRVLEKRMKDNVKNLPKPRGIEDIDSFSIRK